MVGVSQSGEGTDINLVLENAKKAGAFTLGITNEPRSAMAQLVDEVLLIRAGKERSVAATKTYTGQLLMFHLLAAALQQGKGLEKLRQLPELASRCLELEPVIQSLVERYRFINHCLVVGRGLIYANVYELAIKLMETCYVVSERFSSADFLHGPVAMIEADFPVIVFAPPGKTFNEMRRLTQQLRTLKAETLVISSEARSSSRPRGHCEFPSRSTSSWLRFHTSFPASYLPRCWRRERTEPRPTEIAEEGNQNPVRN